MTLISPDPIRASNGRSTAAAQLAAARVHSEQTVLHARSDYRVLKILRRDSEASRGSQGEPVAIFGHDSRLGVLAEIDERYVSFLHAGQPARVLGRGLGDKSFAGTVAVVERLMGNKIVFLRAAGVQRRRRPACLDRNVRAFQAPLSLAVDVEISVASESYAQSSALRDHVSQSAAFVRSDDPLAFSSKREG